MEAGYELTPLSAFQKKLAPPAPPALDYPPYDKTKASSHDFISYLNFFLALAEPPHPSEVVLRKRFEEIGIVPGKPWDGSKLDEATLAAIDAGVKEAQATFTGKIDVTVSSNGLFGSRKALGEDYLKRATAAAMGLYGNDLAEAWYGGYVGDGSKLLQIHFFKIICRPRSSSGPSRFTPSLIAFYTITRLAVTPLVIAQKDSNTTRTAASRSSSVLFLWQRKPAQQRRR